MSTTSLYVPATGVRDTGTVRFFVRVSLLVLFTYVFLANAWLGDDAHITFRTVWNFVHGYGITFNPDERVQAYTHPLWMLAVSAVYFVTREFLFSVTALSWLFNVLAGLYVLRRSKSLGSAALTVGWLLSSKALIDYSSSGLEYPLSYFLLALFYVQYLSRRADTPVTDSELRYFVLVATLGFLNRPDAALLYAIPVGDMIVRRLGRSIGATLRSVAMGASPAIAWLAFATFYYGFPLPNTYYAKVANGIPAWLQFRQGVAYFFNSLRFDPITLSTIALALLYAWRRDEADVLSQRRARICAALSAALSVAYSISVGGDFMSGRFFAMPFLLAVISVVPEIDNIVVPWAGAVLLLYNVVVPIVPIRTTANYQEGWPWRTQNGIKDERGISHQSSNPLAFAPFHTLPDSPFGREGLSQSADDDRAEAYCCIGLYGLKAGPTKHVIDENALADPLLARLPVSPRVYFDFWASHYFREIPEGYVESNERDQNLLKDPLLHEYYDHLRNVTRGPLFRTSRLADIWALNVNYRDLHERYEKRRPIILSFPANHPRFQTDIGVRDDRAGELVTTGREGYLQFGPYIPLKQGAYRVRWSGQIMDAPEGDVGFVEVWNGPDQRLMRSRVSVDTGRHDTLIAQADFTLDDDAKALEYRFYVHDGVSLRLDRIELYSAFAAPADTR